MQIERLTATGENVLSALAEYRYLTAQQLLSLKVTSDKGHLYSTLRTLSVRKPPIVNFLDFGALPGHGRLSRIFYLTQHGATLLEEAQPERAPVAAPVRVHQFRNDYFHRVNTVDTHIAVNRWAAENEATIDRFETYYNDGVKRRGRTYARTRIAVDDRALIPDAIFIHISDNTRLFAVEVSNGRETARVEKKILAYFPALAGAAIERAYSYPHAARLLYIFEHERSLELIQERFQKHRQYRAFDTQIFLKPISEISEYFGHNWRRLFSPKERVPLI